MSGNNNNNLREDRNKNIIKDYKIAGLTYKELSDKYGISQSAISMILSKGLKRENRRRKELNKPERFDYQFNKIDENIYQIQLATTGETRYHVSLGRTSRRFKTLEEAEEFVNNNKSVIKIIEKEAQPIDIITEIYDSDVKFDDMSYVLKHLDENLDKVCSLLLNKKEQEFAALRFKKGLNLQEIADVWGVTRQRISQININVLTKLKSSKITYDYLNRGATNYMLREQIESLEKELEIKKAMLENEVQDVSSKLSSSDNMKAEMVLDMLENNSLGLKKRTNNALINNGLLTVRDVVDLIEEKKGYQNLVIVLKGFGVDCANDLKKKLKKTYGYAYKLS